jgi:hypothetical protein
MVRGRGLVNDRSEAVVGPAAPTCPGLLLDIDLVGVMWEDPTQYQEVAKWGLYFTDAAVYPPRALMRTVCKRES